MKYSGLVGVNREKSYCRHFFFYQSEINHPDRPCCVSVGMEQGFFLPFILLATATTISTATANSTTNNDRKQRCHGNKNLSRQNNRLRRNENPPRFRPQKWPNLVIACRLASLLWFCPRFQQKNSETKYLRLWFPPRTWLADLKRGNS